MLAVESQTSAASHMLHQTSPKPHSDVTWTPPGRSHGEGGGGQGSTSFHMEKGRTKMPRKRSERAREVMMKLVVVWRELFVTMLVTTSPFPGPSLHWSRVPGCGRGDTEYDEEDDEGAEGGEGGEGEGVLVDVRKVHHALRPVPHPGLPIQTPVSCQPIKPINQVQVLQSSMEDGVV